MLSHSDPADRSRHITLNVRGFCLLPTFGITLKESYGMRAAVAPKVSAKKIATRPFGIRTHARNVKSSDFSSLAAGFNFPTIFGRIGQGNQVSLYDQLSNDGGSSRFWSPCLELSMSTEEYTSLPIMFYLPGFDGTGMAGTRQFPLLMNGFDFVTFATPPDDRSSFTELVDLFVSDLKRYIGANEKGRPVYLLGESFGGLLAMAAAYRCPECVDRLVLVNPASSYEQSIWPILGPLLPQIPNELYIGLSFALAPLLGNPISLLAKKLDTSQPIPDQVNNIIEGVLELFGTLGFLGDVLTPECVAQKLELVRQGFQTTSPLIPQIMQRTFLLISDGDWMLPSGNEKNRLAPLMRRCIVHSMGMRSHALLQEAGVNLLQILKDEGFYVTERRFSSSNGKQSKPNGFGTAAPIELPTEREHAKLNVPFASLNRVISPVFYSTPTENMIVQGLEGLPDARPLLVVGNHQLLAPDTALLVEALFREKGILIRGLTHPLVFDNKSNGGRQPMLDLMKTYGAVPVSPKNLYTLLQQKECVLLYPGGARESFKLKNDETYQLFWPEKPEFVRMAAKFHTTIVTLASVGVEDSLEILLDRNDIMQTPILGDIAQRQLQRQPEARPGLSEKRGDFFLPPLVRPKVPRRQYFLFGKPFETTQDHFDDRDSCEELYRKIKEDLENNIAYLRQKSTEDPYRDLVKRVIYEGSNGQKQAPSFSP